jgi:septum site-determining protein MinC
MNAQLVLAAAGSGSPHRLLLPDQAGDPLELVRQLLGDAELQAPRSAVGALRLECGQRRLGASCLAAISSRLAEAELGPITVVAADPLTRVAAAALGLEWISPHHLPVERAEQADQVVPIDLTNQPNQSNQIGQPSQPNRTSQPKQISQLNHLNQPNHINQQNQQNQSNQSNQGSPVPQQLTLHRGTLRSGDHIEAAGSLLVLGDVNPGARVSAGGHVLVWGRLRGVAHAGCHGDRGARIVAMGLQPLQLRIADVIARGPEEAPPPGLAEQASLSAGAIRIDPASASWPLA